MEESDPRMRFWRPPVYHLPNHPVSLIYIKTAGLSRLFLLFCFFEYYSLAELLGVFFEFYLALYFALILARPIHLSCPFIY
ncbi:MAG: hypothetical protein UX71_C0002G0283 [Parcubacteria group bacterium GW2011_GWA1_47_10]|nr:MAG: hypothetical protein UX71_C0002G0283 [Parcubacteria group bacterium GW2011_GWA1_47_10]